MLKKKLAREKIIRKLKFLRKNKKFRVAAWHGVNLILSLSVAAFIFINFQYALILIGSWMLAFIAGGVGLINVFGPPEWKKHLNRLLGTWLIFGSGFIIYGAGIQKLNHQLDNARNTASAYRDTLLKKDIRVPVSGGQPWQLHQFLLGPEREKIHEVRILGINATGVLHGHRSNLQKVLENKNSTIKILLLDKESDAFKKRVEEEEGGDHGFIANRIQDEWETSISIVRDILNQLINKNGLSLQNLEQKLEIKLHKEIPDRSMLYVDRDEEEVSKDGSTTTVRKKYILFNRYPEKLDLPGQESLSLLIDERFTEYRETWEKFNELWEKADTYPLKKLKAELKPFRTWKKQITVKVKSKERIEDIYARALHYHKQRRLDEASSLYKIILERDKPKEPTKEQKALVRKFLPRVYRTENEPFKLKDLVVVLHPNPKKRIIGYHLVWEDDIDFLVDNDPGDHEIVWVQYNEKEEKVEKVWSYWHGAFLSTDNAVKDANMKENDGKVAVYVQWGKHGSLLEGWKKKIDLDGNCDIKTCSCEGDLEPLQFKRLSKEGRCPTEGLYADKWPKRFKGDLNSFLGFNKEIDMLKKLNEGLRKDGGYNNTVVSQYANAVINRWILPYNIRPKPDWPEDIQ